MSTLAYILAAKLRQGMTTESKCSCGCNLCGRLKWYLPTSEGLPKEVESWTRTYLLAAHTR